MRTMTFWEVLEVSYFDQKLTFRKIHMKTSVMESLFNTQNSLKNTCVGVSFKKSCRPTDYKFIKETPAQVFSCESYETY